jgi:hypothetical protein
MLYYSLLSVFAVLVGLIIIDSNVGTYIDLKFRLLRIKVLTLWMKMVLYPNIIIMKWKIKRNLQKIRKKTNDKQI